MADRRSLRAAVIACLVMMSSALAVLAGSPSWTTLEEGVSLAWIQARRETPVGKGRIVVVRIDPARWDLVLAGPALGSGSGKRTAREWAQSENLAVVTNAGMFALDHRTHLGAMEWRGKVGSAHVNLSYESVAAWDPRKPGEAPFRIFDLDQPGTSIATIRKQYRSLVQNLRLVKRPGENVRSSQKKRWSEAALGEDSDGNVLFVFSRSPFSMYELNHELLEAGIGLVALQHLEGGPEAQLYLKLGDHELELFGSYETGFTEDDDNDEAWPIPNVLGIREKHTKLGADEAASPKGPEGDLDSSGQAQGGAER